jgi:ATP-dependent DNA helicase RecG
LRGPGEFLGLKQHGMPELRIGSLVKDGEVMEQAKRIAQNLVANQEKYKQDKSFVCLLQEIKKRFQKKIFLAEIS